MRLTLRAKLLAIVIVAAVALVAVILVSALLADGVKEQLARVRDEHVPLVELGPRLERQLDGLTRAFQDAVAANDLDSLSDTRARTDKLLADLEAAGSAVRRSNADAFRSALEDYRAFATDVSRRLIAGETGEHLLDSMAAMQARQKAAAEALHAATKFDRQALEAAFATVAEFQSTAGDVRLIVSTTCLVAVTLLSLWLARSVLRTLGQLDAGLARFGSGQFLTPIPIKGDDEIARVAGRANEMAKSLAQVATERQRIEWLDAGHAGLVRELRGEMTPQEVASHALAFITRYLEAPVAALYQLEGEVLRLRAHHAAGGGSPPEKFARGEGLVGQAADQDDIVVVPAPPPSYLRVRSGLGESAPSTLVLVPLKRAGQVAGVLELALFKPWTELEHTFLMATRESLAITLDVARANADTKALLAETQALARRLARQDEELRAINEELQAQQEELRQSNEELSQQAAELEDQRRTLADRNALIDEARLALERKNDELATVSNYKSQFLTNMSHELRTPLNSMLLLSNLLAENDGRNLTDRQVEFCRTIYLSGKDLLALINQVLDLAKVEAGKQELKIDVVRLADVAEHARRVFEPLAAERGLTLHIAIAPGLPTQLRTDRQRLDQIITNLLGNAIKFSTEGTVSLDIRRPGDNVLFARSGIVGEHAIAFAISDRGPGIPVDDRERIFAPFEQLANAREQRSSGTGLGLALTRELAHLLGGEIQLESTEGVGSTFTCYLPTRSPRTAGRVLATTLDDRDAIDRSAPHLLIIEDDDTFARSFGEVIHGYGLQFIVANDGASGLELARTTLPSAIILDVKLPDMDGFQVMAKLAEDPRTASIPVHFVSAVDAAERGLALGAVGYLLKPAVRRDLVRVVEALAPSAAARARRILVVEDDLMTGDSLLKMLAAEGLEARRVTSATEALVALRDEGFGCMIVDLQLPDMDGLSLLERVQTDHKGAMPSVVVYTARALSVEEAKRLEAYTEAIVLKEGPSAERVVNEVRLFVRRLSEGTPPRRTLASTMPTGPLGLDGKQALVVDDDMRTVYALSAALRAKGMEVFVADNGRAAIEVLELRPSIDIVLMDIMMPEMDGYEAIRRIRTDARFVALPIIALTAKAMKGDEDKSIQAGASSYLPKPIDAGRLLTLMQMHLARRQPHA